MTTLANIQAAARDLAAQLFGGKADKVGTSFTGAPSNTSFGPDGLNWMPFSSTTSYSYNHATVPGAHAGAIYAASASMTNTPGSGTFGPSSADVAHLASAQKDNYLTSTTEGELDTVMATVRQGRAGDAAAYVGDAAKVKSSTGSDTGGVIGMEIAAAWLNTSGVEQNSVHSLAPFMESASGVSAGLGYGYYTDSWKGVNFAGFYVGNNLANDAATGWQYAFIAANGRSVAGQYFRVRGDKVGGASQPGDIVQGFTGATKTLRTEGGTFKVRNNADDATLFSITDAGALAVAIGAVPNAANDAAAASASVPVGGIYRNGSVLMVRVS